MANNANDIANNYVSNFFIEIFQLLSSKCITASIVYRIWKMDLRNQEMPWQVSNDDNNQGTPIHPYDQSHDLGGQVKGRAITLGPSCERKDGL